MLRGDKRAQPARTTAQACSSHGRFARAVFWTRRSRASFALFARASCTHLSAAVRTGRAHLPMKYENDSVMNAQASQATSHGLISKQKCTLHPNSWPHGCCCVWLSVQEAGRNAGCSELRSGAKLMCMWWPASNLLQLGEWPQSARCHSGVTRHSECRIDFIEEQNRARVFARTRLSTLL